jgi:hypothetical protein
LGQIGSFQGKSSWAGKWILGRNEGSNRKACRKYFFKFIQGFWIQIKSFQTEFELHSN